MTDDPWLTILGLGEDGADGLPPASRRLLDAAEIVIGPERHLGLLPEVGAERIVWPRPFADGIERLLALRGRKVVMLASGDPFWFGAGTTLATRLDRLEWQALPNVSTFSRAAARLGWALERTHCFGLHAAPLARLTPKLAPGARLIVLLRDGDAPAVLAGLLQEHRLGASAITLLEALGGPRERIRKFRADAPLPDDIAHPVAVAVEIIGDAAPLHRASGQPDDVFDHDGQITKRPIRAMTLSALAPSPGQRLWDIGAGSGSIAIEWLLSDPATEAVAIEAKPARAERISHNADRLGCDRLRVVAGQAPAAFDGLPPPDAIFIGGGLSEELLEAAWNRLPKGGRLVANAVTMESEALLIGWRARVGGDLLRVELSAPAPLGPKHGWRAGYPVTQWSVVK